MSETVRKTLRQVASLCSEGWKATRDQRYMSIGLLVVAVVRELDLQAGGNPDRAAAGEIDAGRGLLLPGRRE